MLPQCCICVAATLVGYAVATEKCRLSGPLLQHKWRMLPREVVASLLQHDLAMLLGDVVTILPSDFVARLPGHIVTTLP